MNVHNNNSALENEEEEPETPQVKNYFHSSTNSCDDVHLITFLTLLWRACTAEKNRSCTCRSKQICENKYKEDDLSIHHDGSSSLSPLLKCAGNDRSMTHDFGYFNDIRFSTSFPVKWLLRPQNSKARSLVIDVLLLHLCLGFLGVLFIHKMSYLQLLYSV